MNLTQSQLVTLKTSILDDPVFSALPLTSASANTIADAYNLSASPTYYIYRNDVPVDEIFNSITWKNFTPSDQPPTAAVPSAPTAAEEYAIKLWYSRALLCQGKQFNIQINLQGKNFIAVQYDPIRTGLKDSLQNLPSGPAGISIDAGWATVKQTITRTCTRFERLYVTGAGTGTTGSPDTCGVIGHVNSETIQIARELP